MKHNVPKMCRKGALAIKKMTRMLKSLAEGVSLKSLSRCHLLSQEWVLQLICDLVGGHSKKKFMERQFHCIMTSSRLRSQLIHIPTRSFQSCTWDLGSAPRLMFIKSSRTSKTWHLMNAQKLDQKAETKKSLIDRIRSNSLWRLPTCCRIASMILHHFKAWTQKWRV